MNSCVVNRIKSHYIAIKNNSRKTLILVNKVAGRQEYHDAHRYWIPKLAEKVFGISRHKVRFTGSVRESINYYRKSKSDGFKQVFVAGGDGSVRYLLSTNHEIRMPIGILPLGSGNGLAHGLGVRAHPEEVMRALAHGKITTVPGGKINGNLFANICGFGFGGEMARHYSLGHSRGLIPCIVNSANRFRRFKPFDVHKLPTKNSFNNLFIFEIAINEKWGSGFKIAIGKTNLIHNFRMLGLSKLNVIELLSV